MVYAVNILAGAKEDIAEKIKYVKQEWGSAVAKAAYTELMGKLELLATQSLMGTTMNELAQFGHTDYRVLTHERHTKVLYRVDEDSKVVHIHMVFGSRQNFQDLLYKRIMRDL